MKLETFFEKFELFADAPNAMAKLRELILDLATRGRLVSSAQETGTDPAIRSKQQQFLETLTDSGADEAADKEIFPAPVSWCWAQLGNVAQFINGDRGKNYPSKSVRVGHGIPFINAGHLVNGSISLADMDYISEERFNLLGSGKVQVADVIYCLRGSLGKSAVVKNIERGAVASSLLILRPSKQVLARYLYLYLTSPLGRRMITKYDNGSAQPNLSATNVKRFQVPLPPLAEQKRIVAKVDKLMALCDRLEAQQREQDTQQAGLARTAVARFADTPTPANLELLFHNSYSVSPADLRKTILTLAVQGRLVQHEEGSITTRDTLETVLSDREKHAKKLRLKTPDPVQADSTYTPPLPPNWCYASPDQLTAFHKNALTIGPFGSSLLKSDYTEDGVPLVFVRDIRSETFGGPGTKFVSTTKALELSSHIVSPSDLLITKMGDPPGDTSIYPNDRPPGIITADCIKLTPHPELANVRFLRLILRAPQLAEQFAGITLGVAQQKVSLTRFRCIAVPLPPLAEQRRIVAKVEQLMVLVDQLETRLAASHTTATSLTKAVVAELTEVRTR